MKTTIAIAALAGLVAGTTTTPSAATTPSAPPNLAHLTPKIPLPLPTKSIYSNSSSSSLRPTRCALSDAPCPVTTTPATHHNGIPVIDWLTHDEYPTAYAQKTQHSKGPVVHHSHHPHQHTIGTPTTTTEAEADLPPMVKGCEALPSGKGCVDGKPKLPPFKTWSHKTFETRPTIAHSTYA